MESNEDRRSGPDVGRSPTGPRDGKIYRIVSDMRGLVEDLQKWIDLRLDLAILEVEERIDELRNDVALGITVAIFGFFAALFSLTTLALGIGWLLGRAFWGFLAVTITLILIVSVLQAVKPELIPPSNLFETIRKQRDENSGTGEDSSRGSDVSKSEEKGE